MIRSQLIHGMTFVTLMCGVCFAAQAQTQDAQTPQSEGDKSASIEGVVMNDLTKVPIRRAEVQLFKMGKDMVASFNSSSAYSAVTDAEGKFKIEKIEAGEYRVQTQRAGFVNTGRAFGASSMMLKVAAGESVKALRYLLVPQAIVNGRVVDDEGEPVQSANVQLVRESHERGGVRRVMPVGFGQTNDKGEFRIINVPAGRYYLRAEQRQMGMGSPTAAAPSAPGAPRMGFVATYFPSGAQMAQGTKIEVKPGMELMGQDITLRKEKIYRVSGRVLAPDGGPAKQAMVMMNNGESPMGGGTFFRPADDKGAFSVDGLPAGEYTLSANLMNTGAREARASARADITVTDSDVKDLVVPMLRPMTATGSVVLEGSDRKDVDLSSAYVMAMPASSDMMGAAMGTVKADGSVTFEGLAPRKYRITTFLRNQSAPAYINAILVGSEDVYGRDVDGSTLASAGLRVVYRMDGATVTGTVELPENKDALKGAPTVMLYSTDARLRGASANGQATVDQKGAFTIKALRPGEYMAIAFESIDYTLVEDPDFYTAIEHKGTLVTLKANGSENLTLKLQSVPAEFADR